MSGARIPLIGMDNGCAMSKFESKVVAIPYSQQRVYDTISDLTHLERVRGMLPEDKVRDL